MNTAVFSMSQRDSGLRQVARRPRDSDGVGSALHQAFDRPASLPADICNLLRRLNQHD